MKNKNLIESFKNAISGIIYAIRKERNMKIHVTAFFIVLLLSIHYRLAKEELLIICLTVSLVFICELLNTSVELVVDIITNHFHPKAKAAKDIAAGAVFVSSLVSLAVAYFVFFDRISQDIENVILIIKQSPVYIAVLSIAVTVSAVLIFLYFSKYRDL